MYERELRSLWTGEKARANALKIGLPAVLTSSVLLLAGISFAWFKFKGIDCNSTTLSSLVQWRITADHYNIIFWMQVKEEMGKGSRSSFWEVWVPLINLGKETLARILCCPLSDLMILWQQHAISPKLIRLGREVLGKFIW